MSFGPPLAVNELMNELMSEMVAGDVIASDPHQQLLERMARVATEEGEATFHDLAERRTGLQLSKEGWAKLDGFIIGMLHIRRQRRTPKDRAWQKEKKHRADKLENRAAELERMASGMEADPIDHYYLPAGDAQYPWRLEFTHYDLVPRLKGYAAQLKDEARSIRQMLKQSNSRTWDVNLIVALAKFFAESGGTPTSTPNGPFANLVGLVWHVLPPDNRCGSDETFIQYIKGALPEIRSMHEGLEDLW